MLTHKGQFFTLEYLFSVIIFLAVIVLFIGLNSTTSSIINTTDSHKSIHNSFNNFLDIFCLSKGFPENWEYLDLNSIESIGIVKNNYIIDQNKYLKFLDLNSQYEEVKEKIGLGKYELYIVFKDLDNHVLGKWGIVPDNNVEKIKTERYFIYDNNIIVANIRVWQR